MGKKKEDNGMQNAFKAGIWYTISTLIVKSISIISTPLYTRLMTTEDYGISATFNTWYALLTIICTLNVGYSIGRAKVDFGEKFDEYIGALQLLCATVTAGLFVLVMLFIKPISEFAGLNKTALIWLFAYLLFGSVVSIYQGKYRFKYEYKQNIAISIFISISTLMIAAPLIYFLDEKYMGKIIGTAMPTIVLGVLFWIIAVKDGKLNCKKEYVIYALSFSLPLIVHSISIYILGQSDRLMIKYYCNDSAVGIYSLIYQYAILISLVTNSINQAWNPWFHDNFALKNFKSIKKSINPLIILGCYIGIGCVAVAPEAVLLLGGRAYLVGLPVVVPVALGVIMEFVYTQYVIIEMHLKTTKYVSTGTVIAAIINIVLNMICIPKYGYVAAAYTTLASYFLLWFIHMFITRRILRVHLYRDRKICVYIVMTAVICAILSMFYSNVIIRYSIIVLVTILMLIYNKDFIIAKLKK